MQNLAEIITQVLQHEHMERQCLAASALGAIALRQGGFEASVVLGSLFCKGVPVFSYEPLSESLSDTKEWGGHAWIKISEYEVIDISLLRSARKFPDSSNLRKYLQSFGLLDKGAICIPTNQIGDIEWFARELLPEHFIEPLAEGLLRQNQ